MRLRFSLISTLLMFILLIGCSLQSNTPVVTPSLDSQQEINSGLERFSSAQGAISKNYWSEIIPFEDELWLGRINENGTLDRAFGKGVNVSHIPQEVIDSYPNLFQISSDDLVKVEEYTHDRIRYVFFRQAINGIQLKDSRVELRYGRTGNLVLIGSNVFPNIHVTTVPQITESDAMMIAVNDSGYPANIKELVISKHGDEFYLVWWVLSGLYVYHIDAHNGFILERESVLLEDHIWMTESEMYELSPSTPIELFHYPNQLNEVDIPGHGISNYYADSNGMIHVGSSEDNLDVSSYLSSEYVNVIPCQGVYPSAKVEWESQNDEIGSLVFDDSNSRMGERMVGYWSNYSHKYIKGIDPTFELLDFPLETYADCCCTCNAFAYIEPPYKIQMYQPSGDCVATSEVADVIVHEYGHIYVAVQYTLGRPPLSLHEAFADTLANAVTGQPAIGKDIRGVGTHFRTSDNKVLYDDNDCGGQSHCMGNILAGALWEIRSEIGDGLTNHLWHQARFAQSHSFPDFVVDFFIIDDDNDNILDGTPNKDVFVESFWDNHHIPVPEMPDIPSEGIVLNVNPIEFPLQMDRTQQNNLLYKLSINNYNDEDITVQIWAVVKTPWDVWFGPILPPSINFVRPLPLDLRANQEININLRQSIPAFIPVGDYEYHIRVGFHVDNHDDILFDDVWLNFTMY